MTSSSRPNFAGTDLVEFPKCSTPHLGGPHFALHLYNKQRVRRFPVSQAGEPAFASNGFDSHDIWKKKPQTPTL